MTEKTSQGSKWLGQHDLIPPMTVGDFARLMLEEFGLISDLTPRGKKYVLRLSDKPQMPGSKQKINTVLLPTHVHNGISLDGLVVLGALQHFKITKDQFRKGYNRLFSQASSQGE